MGPMAASETAVTIAITKMGMEPICLQCCNHKCQWEWLHRLQCNQSFNVTIAIAIAITIAITQWEWTFSLKQP